jgi:hypothetical protein
VLPNDLPELSNQLVDACIFRSESPSKIDLPLPLAAEADRVRGGRADAVGLDCPVNAEICITIFTCGDPPLGETKPSP